MAENPPNTSSYPLRTRFALRFLKTLNRMNNHSSQRIKLAAYSSMARAVGPSRIWSRAILFKLRPDGRRRRRRRFVCSSRTSQKLAKSKTVQTKKIRRVAAVGKKRASSETYNKRLGRLSRSDELRRLVPGGEAMDVCSLFEETAHFVQCLATQVKVMQSIVDHYNC